MPPETESPTTTPPQIQAIRSVAWARQAPEFQTIGGPWQPESEGSKLGALAAVAPAELANWIDRFHRAGIIADRNNSPDLFGQLTQVMRRPVDTVLCGVLDSDPLACLNSALASRYPVEMTAGMTLIGKLTRARNAAIVIDSRVPVGWVTSLRKLCATTGIRVEPIINDYPQADPTLMLYALLGRRLRPGRLPTDQGVVILDAAAAVAIGRYALLNEHMLQTPVAIRDHVLNRSYYLSVPIGTLVGDLLTQIGVPVHSRIVRSGDLLRNLRIPSDSVIGGGELVFHSIPIPMPVNPSPCIRCGWCVDSCPTRVQPAITLEASQRQDIDLAEHAGIEACIECGICSYVCPSQLPLLEGIRKIKILMKGTQDTPAQGMTSSTKP